MPVILAPKRQGQKDHEFEAILGLHNEALQKAEAGRFLGVQGQRSASFMELILGQPRLHNKPCLETHTQNKNKQKKNNKQG